MHNYIPLMLLNVLDFILTYICMCKYKILRTERFILSFMFILMEYHFHNPNLIILSRLYLIDFNIFSILLCKLDILFIIKLVCINILEMTFIGILLILMGALQLYVLQNKDMLKRQRININRKIFHVFLLVLYYNPTNFLKIISEYVVLIIIMTTRLNLFKSIFSLFLTTKDNCNILVSHAYLLLSCVIPLYFLRIEEYRANLVSVCVLDTISSIVGIYYKKTAKSIIGSFSGVFSSIIFYYYMEGDFLYFYFIIIGLIEYLDICNDNLSIPVISLLYFKVKDIL